MKKRKETILYRISRPLIHLFIRIVYNPKIIGKENIPKDGSIVLAGNHTNDFDCLLMMSSTKRCIHFLAKDELWKGPKKIIFANMGLIPVNRREKDHNALVMAEEYLNDSEVIGIFPEGTISRTGNLLPFKIGAVKMAQVTKTPIVPFAITGKYKPFRNNLRIVYGKSIYIDNGDLEKQNDKLKKIIEELMVGDD